MRDWSTGPEYISDYAGVVVIGDTSINPDLSHSNRSSTGIVKNPLYLERAM